VLARVPIAFLAGLVSFLAPCVLPLVPGYLSSVSAVEAGRLGERGAWRRVVTASIPFVLGFTVVFVALGTGAAALGNTVDRRALLWTAGFLVIVLGLTFMGLLPFHFPERLAAPGLVAGARRRGSSFLLGGAFGFCAAPCVGPVLASILVLASDTDTIAQGSLLLVAYSAGLAVPFLLAGVAFARAMGTFRRLRDHYGVIQVVSGAFLVAIGALLFFDRFWWLNVALNRALGAIGIGD
jgi:cytochrome c-type biogenesis protein